MALHYSRGKRGGGGGMYHGQGKGGRGGGGGKVVRSNPHPSMKKKGERKSCIADKEKKGGNAHLY